MTDLPLITRIPCTFVMPSTPPFQGEMVLGWHPGIPPLVRMDLHAEDQEDNLWFISRDVLVDCMLGDKDRQYGEGNFSIERGDVSGHITVRSYYEDSEGNVFLHVANINFFVEPMLRFVRDTLMHVPRGKAETEPMMALLDQWLETL